MEPIREQSEKEKLYYQEAICKYADFLANEWTPTLRNLGLIPQYETINIYSVSSKRNAELLAKLRDLNYSIYEEMGNKFIILKSAIVDNGGSLDNR